MELKQAKELVRGRLSDKRYEHTLNVKKMAVKLAKHYGTDPEQAALAALLHDAAKEMPKDEMRAIMQAYPEYAQGGEARPTPVWHGICAAILARTEWGVTDEAVLSAIACHTAGKAGMTQLDKILYLADMTSAERDWPGVEKLRKLEMKDLDAAMLGEILRRVLYEFPVQELDFALPHWVTMLEPGHWLQAQVYAAAMQLAERVSRMKDLPTGTDAPALECDAVQRSAVAGADLAAGSVRVSVELKPEIFYQVLSEQTGLDIGDEAGLMPCIMELARAKRAYEKVRSALEQVEATGYGIVMPSIDELHLEPPEIVHQDGRCGVRLQACAPSIQMMKATIHTEISPIVGTEKQSEDLARSLLAGFEDDPEKLWESNIFGKSLHELVNDGLQNKLLHIPQEARTRLQETLERVINEGCTGLICILI